jgi:hypothetical protein
VAARIGREEPEPVTGAGRIRARRVDDLDRRIIKMLQVDGRLSNTEIARSLEITETTVRKRIAHLPDERLISHRRVLVSAITGQSAGKMVGDEIGGRRRLASRTGGMGNTKWTHQPACRNGRAVPR